ncbi:MAG: AraC family transcriptional regulator [Agriterribacter sp.]
MKNLLQKSLKQLTVFAFIVFALSIPSYFLLVDWIWLKELDENNELIAERIENEFNEQKISDEKLDQSIQFWNEIQPVSKIELIHQPLSKDSLYTVMRQNPYSNTTLKQAFKKVTGTTIYQYYLHKQMLAAKKLLDEGCPVTEVALKVGYSTMGHFSHQFKQKFGTSPKNFTIKPKKG